MATENPEAHGEPVIAVGLDRLAGAQRPGLNFKGVLRFNDLLAESHELSRHPGDAIGLLFPRMGNPADPRWPFQQWSQGGERKKGVRKRAEILVHSVQRRTGVEYH